MLKEDGSDDDNIEEISNSLVKVEIHEHEFIDEASIFDAFTISIGLIFILIHSI